MATSLPLDDAIVYMDFAQNYALNPNDEIQTAHYVSAPSLRPHDVSY